MHSRIIIPVSGKQPTPCHSFIGESYSVGAEQFDNEHRKLVELINRMFVIVRNNDDIMAISDAVTRLIDYTEFHFTSEEEAMKEIGFPDLAAHKQQHAEPVREVTTFQQRLLTDDGAIAPELYSFLRDWLLTHIMNEDKKYARYINNSDYHKSSAEQE